MFEITESHLGLALTSFYRKARVFHKPVHHSEDYSRGVCVWVFIITFRSGIPHPVHEVQVGTGGGASAGQLPHSCGGPPSSPMWA